MDHAVAVLPTDGWAEAAAERIADALMDAGEGGDTVTLFLAGGSTPEPVYECLAGRGDLPWDRTELFFGDERCVPPDDPDSNFRMVGEHLLSRMSRLPAAVHRMEAERPDVAEAAAGYARLLPGAPSIVLLGIGADGHTASLFPGGEAVQERHRRVMPVTGAKPPHRRLTVTPPVLEAAMRVFVLARGASKAEAVARALEGPLDAVSCPAQLARRGTWLLDAASAALLEVPPRAPHSPS